MSLRHSVKGSSEGLRARYARIGAGIARVGDLEERRRYVVAPTPFQDLLVAVLGRGLSLVEPLEGTVVPLVEPPGVLDGDPHQVQLVEGDPERADRPFQDGREGDVERESPGLQQLAGPSGLGPALVGQIDIGPAGEEIFLVPDALAMTQKYKLDHPTSHDSAGAFPRHDDALSILSRRRSTTGEAVARVGILRERRFLPGRSSANRNRPSGIRDRGCAILFRRRGAVSGSTTRNSCSPGDERTP